MPICECGCGTSFERSPGKGVPHRFIPGHQFRQPAAQAAYREGKRRQRRAPTVAYSGSCQCGCGARTEIATSTNSKRGWFVGHPKPYVRGHNSLPRGPEHPHFRGRLIHDGYVYVHVPDHPRAYKSPRSRAGYVPEHRWVWEQANGRYLESSEHVHHLNGDKQDNRPENLVALTRAEHRAVHRVTTDQVTDATRAKLSESTRRAWARRKAAGG